MASAGIWGAGLIGLGIVSALALNQQLPHMQQHLNQQVRAALGHAGLANWVKAQLDGQSLIVSVISGPEAKPRLKAAQTALIKARLIGDALNGPLTGLRLIETKPQKTLAALAATHASHPAAAEVTTASAVEQCQDRMNETLNGRVMSFEFQGYVLTDESKKTIEDIHQVLSACPTGVKVSVEGYADAVGPEEANRVISEARARSAAEALIAAGTPASQVSAKGFGSNKPLADNRTAFGRAINRRVVFRVVTGG